MITSLVSSIRRVASLASILAGTVAIAQNPPPARPSGSAGGPESALFASTPLARSETERTVLAVLADVNARQRRGNMNVPPEDGRLLRILAESIGARHVVELGTSVGYSGLWFSLALERTGGRLTTFEINPERAAVARENFRRAGVSALITLIEGDAHSKVAEVKDAIDLLFLDADKEGYLDYLQKLLPLVRPGGLVIAHNMNAQQADPQYVRAITTNPELETVFVNSAGSGIGVTLKKR